MSKYDQYLKGFLQTNKEVSIEKIGTFTVSRLAADDKSIQTQFIDFKFNKKAQTSDELIDYVVKETGKSKILISSDLSSVFDDVRQYINIGKPFPFAGFGVLSLGRSGEYEFVPAQGNITAVEASGTSVGKTISDASGTKQISRNVLTFFAFLIILLVATGLSWGIYKYINEQKAEAALTVNGENNNDSTNAGQSKTADETVATTPVENKAADSAYYKFIFLTTVNKLRAHNRYDSLKSWGEHVFIDSTGNDSNAAYQLFIKAKLTVKDTAYVKDSIQKYFQRPVKIALQ